jgi:hypothetical protein
MRTRGRTPLVLAGGPRRAPWLLVLAAFAAACRTPPRAEARPEPTATADAEPGDVAALARGVHGARARSGDAPRDDLPQIALSKAALSLGGRRLAAVPSLEQLAAHGLDASVKRSGEGDLFLVTLADGLTNLRAGDAGAPREVRVLVDAELPHRALLEVLFTAGQVGVETCRLVVDVAGHPAEIALRPVQIGTVARPHDRAKPAPLPGPAVASAAPGGRAGGAPGRRERIDGARARAIDSSFRGDDLWLDVDAVVSIDTTEGYVGPGCEGRGPAPAKAVPLREGKPDVAALGACLRKLKAATPDLASTTSVTLTLPPSTTVQAAVDVVDAIRATEAGEPLFPALRFAVADAR